MVSSQERFRAGTFSCLEEEQAEAIIAAVMMIEILVRCFILSNIFNFPDGIAKLIFFDDI